MQERLFRGAWQLPPLQTGDQLWVLDQHGYSPRQWSKTEVVDEADGFDSYLVSYLRRNILAILLMKKAAKRASRQQLKRELTNYSKCEDIREPNDGEPGKFENTFQVI